MTVQSFPASRPVTGTVRAWEVLVAGGWRGGAVVAGGWRGGAVVAGGTGRGAGVRGVAAGAVAAGLLLPHAARDAAMAIAAALAASRIAALLLTS
jgi:hypothetical protein